MKGWRTALSPLQFGISELSGWGWQMPFDSFAQRVRELRVERIEAGPAGFMPERGRRGVRPVAGVVKVPLTAADQRSLALQAMEAGARRLRQLGAEVMVLSESRPDTSGTSSQLLDVAGWAYVLDMIGAAHAIAARNRLKIAIHLHFGTVLQGAEALERILVHSDAGLCLDLGEMALMGLDPVECIELCGRRISHIHVKDVDPGLAAEVRRGGLSLKDGVQRGLWRPAGEGAGDVGEALTELRRQRYQGWCVVEQDAVLTPALEAGAAPVRAEPVEQRALEDARRSLAFLGSESPTPWWRLW